MSRPFAISGGVLSLALLFAPAAGAQSPGSAPDSPIDSLVLVLDVISATHAKPVTGVVLARADGAGPALVLVPADFVSAGAEIIVLDGGTDILRHGRRSRTVARSVDVGIAVLEVDGLERAGVALSADNWPPAGNAGLEFAAWPAAGQLVEGEPLIRRSVRVVPGDGVTDIAIEPALPGVAGPLLNPCGMLAAMHLPAVGHGMTDAGAISGFLAEAGIRVRQAACAAPAAAVPADETAGRESSEDAASTAAPTSPYATADEEAPSPLARPATRFTHPAWWAALAGVALLVVSRYLRRRNPAGEQRKFRLVPAGPEGAAVEELDFKPGRSVIEFEHGGHRVAFELRGDRFTVTDRGEDGGVLALAVGDAPCLPGEVFSVSPGEEISIGAFNFVLSERGRER